MSKSFPNSPTFQGLSRSVRIEANIDFLEIKGELPKDLNGSFVRCHPDPRFPPMLGDDIYVHGDGMLSALRLENGGASYRSRYVQTDRFKAETRAGRSLFGQYRNPWTDDPSVTGMDRGTANTTPLFHAGRLLALKEDSRPYECDPDTLETRGRWTADGAIKSPHITAHPKVDPLTGEAIFFGFQAKGPGTRDIAYYSIDRDGNVNHEVWFEAPFASFMHDFFITENYAIFPVFPAVTLTEKVKAGEPYYWWDPELPTWIGVLPRKGSASDIQWFSGPGRFGYHFYTAWEEGRRLHMKAFVMEPEFPMPFPVLADMSVQTTKAVAGGIYADGDISPTPGAAAAMPAPTTRLVEWIVNLDGPETAFEEITHQKGKFAEAPRYDPRYETKKLRHGWANVRDLSRSTYGDPYVIMDCNVLEHYDFSSGEVQQYWYGEGRAGSEPLFVPRHPAAPEGDGYIVMCLNVQDGQGSEFIVLDALDIGKGPLATMSLPYHPRFAFHGTWIPLGLQTAQQAGPVRPAK
ncbi:carotenoid oxygenase family protein [Paraburkholderia sp. MM5384-R2]|uniref:carotenoid oxygenase family protein n=1 Tax=Paraburkholderia sp. MM5384-R2 TaxID=2723097 RepID=UPI00161955FF|nr:carotenoid oxygenase family protein [Paraburkholderia sp. MM5384-R2]MBB5499401.1 carotenoid cleavage dioxygenase [Paraburkholderia sp. MM5384-R2]